MLTFTAGGGTALKAEEFADFDTGQAVYRITGIGAFTLGWNPDWHPDADRPPKRSSKSPTAQALSAST
ncbi:hypothetical protein ACFVGN_00875 [Streptomyces sp. NPDC057757]|uniref:hypothetical protein n=1 Tax=Streptomyces sp. NPDC057757 TaxID=3346241 RepID=UPI0036A32A90